MFKSLAIGLLGVVASTRVEAAQPPRTAQLHSAWKLVGEIQTIDESLNLFASTGFGISFNNTGTGFLHEASWICVSAYRLSSGNGIETGHCVITDSSGDQIYTDLKSHGPAGPRDIAGEYMITGGTGKYLGISGAITEECTIFGRFHQLSCIHSAKYSVP
jgi:hypothetical protein